MKLLLEESICIFDFGRSIEGKISRQVGQTNESSSPLVQVGWLNPTDWKEKTC